MRQHNEVVGEETSEGVQANSRDTIPTNQISLGSSTARENVRESGQADLDEKHDFSVHAEISAVRDLNSVASSNFDVGLVEQHPDSLSEAVGRVQQHENRPMSTTPVLANSFGQFSQSWHVSDNAAGVLKNSAFTVFESGDLRQHPDQRQDAMGSAGTPEHRRTGSRKHAANLCDEQKTGWQATDERVNSAIPLVSASEMVEQHPTYLPDIVDTIGQLAHSQTDPLEHAATAAGIDTVSERLQAIKSLTAAILLLFLQLAT